MAPDHPVAASGPATVITPPGQDIRLADDLRAYLAESAAPGSLDGPPPQVPAWPSDQELVRLGRLLELGLYQAVVLVLKGQWERFRAERETDCDGAGRPGGRYLHREFHAGAGGTADAPELFRLFEGEARFASGNGYDEDSFRTLIHHCILLHLHVLSFHGPEVQAFAATQQAQQSLLTAATPGERDAFWCRHRRWREMEDEVGSLLLEVEGQVLENRRVERQWMETFGAAYLPLLEAEARFRSLERALARKAEDPRLTLEELESLEAESRKQAEREMARLRRTLARSRVALLSGPGGVPLDDLETLGYEEECRVLLREIYRLTHPDVVGHQEFTARQRERLTSYYREAVSGGKTAELDDEEISLGMRSLVSLQAILAQVRKIWEAKGLDLNEGAVICGDTLAERLDWLGARISELEEQARQVRADLLGAATDADIAEKRACLGSREQVAAITGAMEGKRQWYEGQIPSLEAQLRELFEGEGERERSPP